MKEIIVKIKKNKSWFSEKINKVEKSLARLKKKKKERERRIKSIKLEMDDGGGMGQEPLSPPQIH